jgi:hypothetical protein
MYLDPRQIVFLFSLPTAFFEALVVNRFIPSSAMLHGHLHPNVSQGKAKHYGCLACFSIIALASAIFNLYFFNISLLYFNTS